MIKQAFIVAITHMPPDVYGERRPTATQVELEMLSKILSMLPFDVRRYVAGAAPWILSKLPDEAKANELVQALRTYGFGAVMVNSTELNIFTPRDKSELSLREQTLVLEPQHIEINLAQIVEIYVATHSVESTHESIERATVAHDGRGRPVKVDLSHHDYTRANGIALYLFVNFDTPILCLSQDSVRIPWINAITARERMDRFVEELVARCPFAKIDRSLLDHPRLRRESASAGGRLASTDTSTSNRFECDLAVRIMVNAMQIGQ